MNYLLTELKFLVSGNHLKGMVSVRQACVTLDRWLLMAVGPGASSLASVSLRFFLYKMEKVKSTPRSVLIMKYQCVPLSVEPPVFSGLANHDCPCGGPQGSAVGGTHSC